MLGTLLHQTNLVAVHVQILVSQWKISQHWMKSLHTLHLPVLPQWVKISSHKLLLGQLLLPFVPNEFGPDGLSRSVYPGVSQQQQMLLMTCQLRVVTANGQVTKARALLDPASSTSFITEQLAQLL